MIPVMNKEQVLEKLMAKNNSYFEEYYAFYSSWFGGIVTDPHMMFLPIDDHMVHRGDGVFEAMKAIAGSVYLMDEHLTRFFTSAKRISLEPPFTPSELKTIILETLRVANQSEASIRIFLSRGPGSFSVNPYEAIGPQLYIIATRLTPPSSKKYEQGVLIGKSQIPTKPGWLAQIKSCNYLPNVLMKKEAVDRGLDFVIAIDDQGYVTESATENILIIDNQQTIIHPPLDSILKGTTMIRACELAIKNGYLCQSRLISIEDLNSASEVIITGTTLNILPVVKFENNKIGDGTPGPIAKHLNELMLQDIQFGID